MKTRIKAVVAALAALFGTLGTALADDAIDATELGVIALAVAGVYAAVYKAPANAAPEG